MKSKKIISLSVAAAVVLSIGSFAGCITTNSSEDIKQTIAVVNIANNAAFKEEFGADYASAVSDDVILKRDLYVMYLSGYYQYESQVGSRGALFNLIKNSLVTNSVVTQYATVSLLYDGVQSGKLNLSDFKAKQTETEKYEYILGGKESEGVRKAEYRSVTMINNTLDSVERTIIQEEDGFKGTGTRSTPTGIDTVKDDYIPETFGFYTGYGKYDKNNAGSDYDGVKKSSRTTRRRAYSRFLSSLEDNNLISENDVDRTDVENLSYVRDNYVSYLQQSVIEEFNDAYEKKQEEIITSLTGEGEDAYYGYLQNRYEDVLSDQKKSYATASDFESAMGSLSDSTFILYSPSTTEDTEEKTVSDGTMGGTKVTYGTFGYVYNILLPFSAPQNGALKILQTNRDNGGEDENNEGKYFEERNKLLKNIYTTDQRANWFNGETDYSFNATEYNADHADAAINFYKNGGDKDYYLFFENNLTRADKYEPLEKYAGLYPYNGTVAKNKNGSYNLVPNKLNIYGMLKEFAAYVNFVVGSDVVKCYNGDETVSYFNYETGNTKYYENTADKFMKDGASGSKEIDYSRLIYATGKVEFSENKENLLTKDGNRYKAMSAVNELQYAYTTDTGVLSQYIGYTVSAYETSYIKEFEYAAQQALRMGAGTFKVCAGDYGWHLIYVTDTFSVEGDAEYTPKFTYANVFEKEGSFENRFYEWVKSSTLTDQSQKRQSVILRQYNNETAVKTYESAYKDLLES